jgi:hypothetical protein
MQWSKAQNQSQHAVGPLLWHWENNTTNDLSIELSLEDVKALARKIGLVIQVFLFSWLMGFS